VFSQQKKNAARFANSYANCKSTDKLEEITKWSSVKRSLICVRPNCSRDHQNDAYCRKTCFCWKARRFFLTWIAGVYACSLILYPRKSSKALRIGFQKYWNNAQRMLKPITTGFKPELCRRRWDFWIVHSSVDLIFLSARHSLNTYQWKK